MWLVEARETADHPTMHGASLRRGLLGQQQTWLRRAHAKSTVGTNADRVPQVTAEASTTGELTAFTESLRAHAHRLQAHDEPDWNAGAWESTNRGWDVSKLPTQKNLV